MASNGNQPSKNRNFIASVRHALVGVATVFRQEANFRRECWLGLLVIICAVLLQPTFSGWLALLAVILLVLASELINTVVENLVDLLVGHHFDAHAKRIKDMSAAFVLLCAAIAVVVGVGVLLPRVAAIWEEMQ